MTATVGRSVRGWRALSLALAVAGAACLVMWGASSPSGEPVTATIMTASPPASPTATAAPPATPLPVRLTIPAIGVSTPLVRLGLQDDGTVEVPSEPLHAGWYDLGPAPGAVGSAVVLGHVDSEDGPAVFARLAELVRGDIVRVARADGSVASFAVASVRTYANADFPGQRVYGAARGRQLNLVTCGGAYDADRGGYQSNVVVNARLMA